jgi:hypothetical protein
LIAQIFLVFATVLVIIYMKQKMFRNIRGKLVATAMFGALGLFVAALLGLCGRDTQDAMIETVKDVRDWNHHYYINQR